MKKTISLLLSLMLTLAMLIMASRTTNIENLSSEKNPKDLVVHSLYEDTEPGYYDVSSIWTIEKG